jgi:hypothetical protein
MFQYAAYGILDRNNVYHADVTWDAPYARSDAQFLASLEYFFERVKQLDPNLHLLCNEGTMQDYSQFRRIYSTLDGLAEEDLGYYYLDGTPYRRWEMYQKFLNDSWMGQQGKVTVFKWMSLTDDATLPDQLRRAYMHYLMVRGTHSFFDPQFNVPEVPPSTYGAMTTGLGLPVAPTTIAQAPDAPVGYVLYTRPTQNGIAYLNWTGTTQTITLPAGHTYLDHNGHPVSHLTIPDMQGDYVLLASATTSSSPMRPRHLPDS